MSIVDRHSVTAIAILGRRIKGPPISSRQRAAAGHSMDSPFSSLASQIPETAGSVPAPNARMATCARTSQASLVSSQRAPRAGVRACQTPLPLSQACRPPRFDCIWKGRSQRGASLLAGWSSHYRDFRLGAVVRRHHNTPVLWPPVPRRRRVPVILMVWSRGPASLIACWGGRAFG